MSPVRLRSMGQVLHPVGPLNVTNMVSNPSCNMADGSNNLLNYTTTNATFKKDLTHQFSGLSSGKFTVVATNTPTFVLQRFSVQGLQTYTASMYINIPSTISTALSIIGLCYASDLTPIPIDDQGDFALGGQVLTGVGTAGWIRTSITFTVVAGTAFLDVYFINPSTNPTALDSFYVDALQLEPNDTAGIYTDGDLSGYVWAGTQGVSYTLQSQFPDAFNAFQTGALSGAVGGMRAHAHMTRPNIVPLLD